MTDFGRFHPVSFPARNRTGRSPEVRGGSEIGDAPLGGERTVVFGASRSGKQPFL